MLRRDFVRAAVTIGLAPGCLLGQQASVPAPPPPAPVPWTLGLNPLTPLPRTEVDDGVADGDRRFFTAVQMATLVRLAGVLVPALDGKPGAVEAGTPLFLDFLIGASPAARKGLYTGGLDWLDKEALRMSRRPFAALDDEEADAVLRPWLRTWMSDHPPTEPRAGFVNIVRDEMLEATWNSKAWADAASSGVANGLYWTPIEPAAPVPGAEPARVPPHVQAAPRAAHSMPSYPR